MPVVGWKPTWPALLDIDRWPYMPAYHEKSLRRLRQDPPGVILHSGDEGPGTAEWAWKEEAKLFAHFAWRAKRGCYVQTCSMHLRAQHAETYNGFIGIEMPGPDELNPRPSIHRVKTVELLAALRGAVPTARLLTGHQFTDKDKHDPGPGVTADWFDGLGYEVYWYWVGQSLLRKV